jgi:hypothetical protein
VKHEVVMRLLRYFGGPARGGSLCIIWWLRNSWCLIMPLGPMTILVGHVVTETAERLCQHGLIVDLRVFTYISTAVSTWKVILSLAGFNGPSSELLSRTSEAKSSRLPNAVQLRTSRKIRCINSLITQLDDVWKNLFFWYFSIGVRASNITGLGYKWGFPEIIHSIVIPHWRDFAGASAKSKALLASTTRFLTRILFWNWSYRTAMAAEDNAVLSS